MKVKFASLSPIDPKKNQEILDTIRLVVENERYILGPNLEKFESNFAKYCQTAFSVGVGNGTDALTLSLQALGINKGDEIIVPSHTFLATWLAVKKAGGVPIGVEPDKYFGISSDEIQNKITNRTKAIIPVHMYGQPADMFPILEIAKNNNLHVIEDAAQAHGSKLNGKTVGSFGHLSCFSFYPTKNLGAFGDGGAINTSDEDMYIKLKSLRNYGFKEKYIVSEPNGLNSRLDELQASILNLKLKWIDQETIHRQYIADLYIEKLSSTSRIVLPELRKSSTHVWHLFVIRTNNAEEIQRQLLGLGIETMRHYPVPPHMQIGFKDKKIRKNSFPRAELLSQEVLSLPMGVHMDEEKVDMVVNSLSKVIT